MPPGDALADVPGVWLDPEGWSILGSVLPGASAMTVYVNSKGYQLTTGECLQGAELLHEAVCELAFDLTDSGCTPPAQVFVSGSSAELGRWREDRAIPLQASERPGSEFPSDWRRRIHVLNSDEPVEYKYFMVTEPGGSPILEHGPNRTLPPPQPDRGGNLTRPMRDSWRNA
jgi:hypothetical protein